VMLFFCLCPFCISPISEKEERGRGATIRRQHDVPLIIIVSV